jgi:hypothetical protein
MEDDDMISSERLQTSSSGKWITILIWIFGIALLLAKPRISTLFALNTNLYMFSYMGPLWAFVLVCLLAVMLRVFRKPAEKWAAPWRFIFAGVLAAVLMLPQADTIMIYRESGQWPHYIDPMRKILLWVTPLTFYVVPAAVIVISWLQHNRAISTLRAVGLALVFIGIIYIPFGLWLNQLALKYTQP